MKNSINYIKQNSYYLGIIQNLFGGNEGEVLTALQFIYQFNIVSPFENDFAGCLEVIYKEDLEHINMLSEIIISLGGDPIYANAQNKYISGKNVDYIKNITQFIDLDIEIKEKTIIDYKMAISKIEDGEIILVLNIILNDEKKHKDILNSLREKLKK